MITYVHDIGDIFVSLLKGFVILGQDTASHTAFPVLLLVWIFTRCMVLPYYTWQVFQMTIVGEILPEKVPAHFICIVVLELIALLLIQIHHLVWFVKLVQIFLDQSYVSKSTTSVKVDSEKKT